MRLVVNYTTHTIITMTMVPIQEHIDHLLGLVFNKDASSSDLFMLACVWGVFWAIFFFIAGILLTPLVYGKEWLRRATEKEIERSGGAEEMNKMHGDNKTKEEWIDVMMKAWVKNQLMIPVQHVASGVPCIPSLLGIGDPAWASSLAAQGLLCEMGWELSDFVELIYKRLRYGEKMIPNGHLIMATLHHSLSCTLAIPMIRRYREWKVGTSALIVPDRNVSFLCIDDTDNIRHTIFHTHDDTEIRHIPCLS